MSAPVFTQGTTVGQSVYYAGTDWTVDRVMHGLVIASSSGRELGDGEGSQNTLVGHLASCPCYRRGDGGQCAECGEVQPAQ